MILLHGWGANKNTFLKLANHFSDRFCVYSLDLPGFGETEVGLPLNLYEVSELIYLFCQKEHIEAPILLGHSYGGRVAICYASKYSVDKLILVSSAGLKQNLTLQKKLKVRTYKILRSLGIKIKMGSKDYLDADNVRRRMLLDAIHTDLSDEMNQISCETILIYGSKDTTTPTALGKEIKSKIKNSAMIEIENAEHFPYLEQPTVFHLIIDSFLVRD